MKDIDFDELDKAVNSLMSPSARSASRPSTANDIPNTSQSTQSAAEVTPVESSKEPAASPVASRPAAELAMKPANAVKRSSGRFMDVVHPSSDMRTPTPVSTPARSSGITPPSRSRPVATPSLPSLDKQPEVKSEETPVVPVEKSAQDTSFPDPIDAMPVAEAEKEAPTEIQLTEPEVADVKHDDIPANAPLPDASENDDESSETLESLFLPNVKVEKRPLGMSSSDLSAALDEGSEEPEADDAEKKDKTNTLVTPDPTLAELGDDVLAIESDASASPAEGQQPDTIDQSTSPASAALASSAISSIPRQYSVKPSSDDKHHEALYDTAAQAGAPLQHPAKKKSGWMVILWIVLLMVVGVGGALALYFLKVF